jgi:hypothetical protein
MYYTQITQAKHNLRRLAEEAVEVWLEAGLPIEVLTPSKAPVCVPTYARPRSSLDLSQILPRSTPDQPQTAR